MELDSGTMPGFDIMSPLMRSLSISLTSPATLEHLEFNIETFYEDLCGADAWRHLDSWSDLDSITTHPTGSRLQRVDIKISYSFRYYYNMQLHKDKPEVVKAVLDGLPLLRAKGILFVEATVWE
jgi:nicotinic acid mononucleotide adenylyltransferase